MDIFIYVLAGISILLAIGGLSAYSESMHPGLLISTLASIAFSALAIYLVHWWPLVISFGANWGLRLLGAGVRYIQACYSCEINTLLDLAFREMRLRPNAGQVKLARVSLDLTKIRRL